MTPSTSRGKTVLLLAVKTAILVLVLWAVGDTLRKAAGELSGYDWSLRWGWLAAAGLIYLVGLLPAGIFWWHVLRVLGQPVALGEALRAYYIGHLGKYVPGKAMVVVLRAGLVRGRGVNRAVAAAGVFFETLTMMAVGAFLAAAILACWFRGHADLLAAALGLMVVAGLPTVPAVFRFLVRLARVARSDPRTQTKLQSLGAGTLAVGWVLMTASWVILALSLWATLEALGVEGLRPLVHLPYYTAAVSLAMVAGFLSLIPGGLGVRDMILAELMVPYFALVTCPLEPAAAAVASAAVLRVVWLVSELVLSAILYFGPRRRSCGRRDG